MPKVELTRTKDGGWKRNKTALPSEIEQRNVGLKADKPLDKTAKVENKKATKASSNKE